MWHVIGSCKSFNLLGSNGGMANIPKFSYEIFYKSPQIKITSNTIELSIQFASHSMSLSTLSRDVRTLPKR